MTDQTSYVVGVDIGGTKIFSGVIDQDGKIYATAKAKTLAAKGFEVSFQQIVTCIETVVNNAGITMSDIQAIGVGSPGPLDIKNGVVIETPNLKWKNIPIKARIAEKFNKPVKVDNDVNTGTYGELIFGAGKGVKDMIGLFVGTGLGGGVIIDGKLLHGFNQNAGELGHIIIHAGGERCGCGVRGHLEAYASKTGIEKQIREELKKGHDSSIEKKLKGHDGPIKSSWLAKAYFNKDKVVVKAVNRSARYLGYGVATLLNVFNPEMVVLGGGVVESMGNAYIKKVIKFTQKNVFPIAFKNVKIVPAALGDNSVILGASVLAYEALAEN